MLEHKINKNKFVDFCNGDVKGEDTETLNHFDEHTRYQFTRMLYAYGTGMTGQNPFANDEKVEITADIDSATHTSFYVNGQKAFTAITGMSYLPSEIQTFGTIQQPFKTRGYKPCLLYTSHFYVNHWNMINWKRRCWNCWINCRIPEQKRIFIK